MASTSLLDQQITLADIIDPEALERVCGTFASLFATGVSVLDHRGKALVDAKDLHPRIGDACAGDQESCPLGGHPAALERLWGSPEGVNDCACGLQTATAPLEYQGHTLGYLVLGPFRNINEVASGRVAEQRRAPEPGIDGGLSVVLTRTGDEVFRALEAVRQVLSVIVQTGYARHLTSQIHIAAIQDAYNELIEKNRRLADSVEKLKELDRLKNTFLATVSHELRTPLTSIIGYTEMLQEEIGGPINERQRQYLTTVMRKGDQLLQLINEILDISITESGKVQLSYGELDLHDVLRDVQDTMIPQARRKQLDLEYEPPEGPLKMRGDRAKVRQILINLLSNAIKFTERRGRVEMSAQPASGAVPGIEVRVRDTGIGIREAHRGRIFEAFYQIDNSATRQHGGTGLGLSLVKHLVEAHGGRSWVEDPAQGPGSVFVVVLPLDPAPAEADVGSGAGDTAARD